MHSRLQILSVLGIAAISFSDPIIILLHARPCWRGPSSSWKRSGDSSAEGFRFTRTQVSGASTASALAALTRGAGELNARAHARSFSS